VPSEQTRYAVGSILSEGEPPAQDLVKIYEKSGFKIFSFPGVTHAVTTTFPFRTFLSIYLAIWRVFPAIKTYTEERKLCAHPCIEVYTADTIHYFLPLARQSHFYVPEVEPNVVEKKGLVEHSDTVADSNGSEATGRDCGSQESVSMATTDSISGISIDTVSMATSESTSVCPTEKRVNVAESTSLCGRGHDGAGKDDSSERSDSAGSSSSFEELRVEDDTWESTDKGTRGTKTPRMLLITTLHKCLSLHTKPHSEVVHG
uniref:Testis expressed 264, ER-phagy receptor a n=1 Tax=Eptatretus burgeri TaxID=7764 RepID=A0A8C4R3J3_EPTBU